MTEDEGRSTPDVAFDFENNNDSPLAPVGRSIQHTDDGGRLRAWNADPLRLEAHDAVPALQVGRIGAGLQIVDGVADEWGGHVDATGKTMWAEFRRPAD